MSTTFVCRRKVQMQAVETDAVVPSDTPCHGFANLATLTGDT